MNETRIGIQRSKLFSGLGEVGKGGKVTLHREGTFEISLKEPEMFWYV